MNTDSEDYGGSKVLVCDDDITYLMLMRETLEAAGFDVIEANDGNSAIEYFNQHLPDLVMLDVHMPGLTGFEVCSKIRSHPQGVETPILMVTGADDFKSISQAYKLGATDFLPKPIKWPMMGHRVRYMLKSRNMLRDLKSSEKRLRYIAYHDSLTGLPNRESFNEHLTSFLSLAKRNKTSLAVMLIDLDRFKRINDTLGHEYGDKLLKLVAQKLQQCVRQSDIPARLDSLIVEDGNLARFGGDEFTILLNQLTNLNDAAVVAKRIIDELSKPLMLDDFEVVVTPSIGISVYPDDGDSPVDLLKFADIAMYKAKDNGRHTFNFYSDTFDMSSMARLNLEEDMRQALKQDEFELYFQPKIDINKQCIKGLEALIRWHHPKRGMVSPAEFIPLAEESGLIVKIGEWVLESACQHLQKWQNAGFEMVPLSVNVSGIQFKRTALPEFIAELLEKYQISPDLLEIEITESAIMTDVEDSITRLSEIKAQGISIAIDDFGTGYSSLSYLKKFPIDVLKIDRSFIIDVATNQEDAGIVNAILGLSESLGLKVVAEGVEDKQQLSTLKLMGCAIIQGFLFSKPMSSDKCYDLMASTAAQRKLCAI